MCVQHRLGLVLIPSTGAPDDVDRVREAAVDGFVLWTTVDDDPVLGAVAADDRSAARAVAQHMPTDAHAALVLSHPLDRDRWTGLLWGPATDVPFPVTRARLSGCRDAVEASGRRWADVPVAVVSRHRRDCGADAVAAVLDHMRPDVVICMSDQLAAGALDAVGGSLE